MFGITKRYLNNQKGTLLPFLVVALVIMIMFAGLSLATAVSFLHRKAAYDALDVALLSSLMTVEERSKPTKYKEDFKEIGDTTYYFTEPLKYKKYIYIDENKAREMFRGNLYTNFYGNTKDSKITGWSYTVRIDDERYLDVFKDLPNLHTENYSVTYSDSYTDENGVEHSYSWTEYYNFDGIYNPESWWIEELGKLLPGPAGWTNATHEEKRWCCDGSRRIYGPVPFPRWVEITATVTADVPSPLGSIFGKGDRQIVTVKAKAIREVESLE